MPLSLQFGESSALLKRSRESDAVLATALRRLASGLRIERASDDPGRLSGTVQLQARIRGSSVGLRNLSAGSSLLETVDGGLAEAEQILQRLRELSLVAISEQRTSFERRALQGEADQLIEQLSQISENRGYQGMRLFDGTPTRFQLQSGRGGEGTENLLLRFADLRPTSLGRQARYEGGRRGVFLSPLLSGELTINGVSIRGSVAPDDQISTKYNDGSALAKAAAINSATRHTGVRAIVGPTVVSGFEALRAIDLSEDHFLFINGQKISGFEVHARDAGGHLITEINRASEASGVVASVDDEGRITLTAEDGRNIQVVYSDVAVREAVRFIDTFGDKLNLSNTVELSSPDRTLHGKVEPGVNKILEVDSTYSGAVSASGEYQLPRDHVDYVIQIVEAGPVGVAKYRFKEELVSDPNAGEDFAFLAGNVDPSVNDITAGGSPYLSLGGSITPGGSYNEGIDRTFTLEVTRAGTTDGTLAERAKYSVRSDVDGALGTDLLATNGVAQQIDDEGVTVTFGQTTRSQNFTGSSLAAGHDYDRTPSLRGNYTADINKSFIIEVSEGGYTDGSAELKVSEDGGTTFGLPIAIQGNTDTAIGDGLSLRFPDRNGVIQSPVSNLSGTFTGSAVKKGNYVGTEDSTFVLQVTQAGALGASARAEVLRDGVVQGPDFALTSGSNITLGDGAKIRLTAGSTTLSGTTSSTSDGYNGPVTISGPYSGEENNDVIVRVRNAGRVDGSARLEYSLDNGGSYTGNIAATSGGAINLNEGLQIQFASAPTPTYGAVVNGSGSYSGSVSFGGAYTGESDSSVIVRARESGALSAAPTIASTARSTSDGYAGAVTIGGSYDGSAGDNQVIVKVREAGRVDGSARIEYSLDGGTSFAGDLAATSGAAVSLAAGLEISFAAAQTPTVSAPVIDSGLYAGPALISGTYTGEVDAALVVAFDAGGTIGAGASYKVSFDGGTTFGASTAAVVGDNTLGGGLTLNLAAGDVVIGDEIRASIETHALAVGDSFSANISDGLVSLEASTDGGGSFGAAFSARAGQVQNLGDGVQVTLGAGQLTAGDTLSAAIETYALADGDTFSASFTGDRLEVGDTFTVDTSSRDLAVGTRYFVEAGVNRLELGDEFEVTARHSYDNAVPAVVTPTVNLSNGVDVHFGAGGSFAVGDEFQIHTRGYTGDPIATGLYTDTLYPTTYNVTVTDEGDVDGGARIRYDRADGRGSGTNIPAVSTAPKLLSENVHIHFTPGFLSAGDQFFISAGEKLEYVFGGTITLQSEEQIELSVSDGEVGNQIGRLLYTGDEALSDEAGVVGNLLSGRLGTNRDNTIATTSFVDKIDAERSLTGIDLAIKQVGEQRTLIGAALNRLSHQSSIISQQRAADQRTLQLLRDADVSKELTNRVRAQLQQEIGVQLLQAAQFKPRLALQLLEELL